MFGNRFNLGIIKFHNYFGFSSHENLKHAEIQETRLLLVSLIKRKGKIWRYKKISNVKDNTKEYYILSRTIM
jgi:hypothetical protein